LNMPSSEQVKQVPFVEGLFVWPSDKPQLIGGRCKSCGRYYFPRTNTVHIPGCRNPDEEEVLLSPKGILRSYTWIYYESPPPYRGPSPFVPYGIGLVELPEGINVVGMLSGCELKDLKTGMDVKLSIEAQFVDEDGTEFLTWKFRPLEAGQR